MNYEENGECFTRLVKEWLEHDKLIIAFDFDNTVYDFHKTGMNLKRARTAIKDAHAAGHEVYCFTANSNEKFVKDFCQVTLGFEPEINKSSLDHLFGTRKPFYSLLLDDRAGLESSVRLLEQINEYIKTKKDNTWN